MSKKRKNKVKITKQDLELHLELVRKKLDFLKRAYELNRMLRDIRVKNPKVLNPNFEFETTPEYQEYLKEKAKYDFDYWYEFEYLTQLKALEDDLDKTNQQLQLWGGQDE